MYNLGDVQETTGVQPMNPGIRENVKMTNTQFAPITEGNDPVIQVEFEDEFGGTLREILWDVDEEQVKSFNDGTRTHARDDKKFGFVKGQPITDEDAVLKAQQLFLQRAKHIATKFVSEQEVGEATKDCTSYAEFGKAYAGLFTDEVMEKQRVRLKVVLNNKDYSTLPKYPPFIEKMSVPKEGSTLEINPKYDRVEKVSVEQADDPTSFDPTSFDEPGF